jgi:uncharacterized protein (TIGR02186 family)
MKTRQLLLIAAFMLIAVTPVQAERLITSISSSRVLITSSFAGTELVLFGAIERDGTSISRSGTYDVVVIVKGPNASAVVREKQRIGLIWANANQRKYADLPGYLSFSSSRPIADVTSQPLRERFQLSVNDLVASRGGPALAVLEPERFHSALIRLKSAGGLFQTHERGVVFLAPNLFRAAIALPATAPLGNYEASVTVFADGAPCRQCGDRSLFLLRSGHSHAGTQLWLVGQFCFSQRLIMDENRIPPMALALSLLGAVPLMACSFSLTTGIVLPFIGDAPHALVTYCAVILSFLGGVRWGFALRISDPVLRNRALLFSVAPAIMAWLLVLPPTLMGFIAMPIIFLLVGVYDDGLPTIGAPLWYRKLRRIMTVIVVLTLITAVFGLTRILQIGPA